MIAFLSGILDEKFPDRIYIEVQGIGYVVYIPTTTYRSLPEKGAEVKIYTYFHVREDAQVLFGFLNMEEVEFFTLLTQTSGIGPKMALKILSFFTISECQKAILQSNISKLSSIPGVGKKTAQRMILDLKDKIAKISLPEEGEEFFEEDSSTRDALLALESLGYKPSQAKKALLKAKNSITDKDKDKDKDKVEILVKLALKDI